MTSNFSKSAHHKTRWLVLLFTLIMLIVGVMNYRFLISSQATIIEHEALRIAEVTAVEALSARSVYTNQVADKLTRDGYGAHTHFETKNGFVPLPAQFLKLVGRETSLTSDGLYSYTPLSKWNLEPSQGLRDSFQRDAWAELEQQDQPAPDKAIDWKPVWRFETVNGVRMLRYLRADPAASSSCVDCHTALEQTQNIIARRVEDNIAPGKTWKLHQLLGAIEVDVPVDKVESIASGQARTTLISVSLTSACGLAIAAWLAMRDVKRERLAAAHFEKQAKFDPLTRLGNRALFNERATLALASAKRSGSQIGVLFIDLNRFKPINDTYGHAAGDIVLHDVGQRFVRSLRVTDLVIRQGGDEFLVLIEATPDSQDFAGVAQKLLDALAAPIDCNGTLLQVSASIGISRYPEHGGDLASLVEKADAAMYEAKQQGGNTFHLWVDRTGNTIA